MNVVEQIWEAVCELQSLNCKKEDLVIAYSPLISKFIIEELNDKQFIWLDRNTASIKLLYGIKIYDLHPYNEIVVYDSINVSYHPQLLKKIEVSITNRRPDKINQE